MFDITTQAVADTTTIHVKNANGEPLYADGEAREKPVQIVVYGPGSKAYATVEARQTARSLKRMNDNEGKITAPTAEEQIAEAAEDLATLTASFNNFSYPPAGDAQGTALFEAVYRDQKLGFITRQVSKAVRDWGLFKPGSAAS